MIKTEIIPVVFLAVGLSGCLLQGETEHNSNELVMSKGMEIAATTSTGTIVVTAEDGLKRTYAWNKGSPRSITLWPRRERWLGSLGAYYPGEGEHWAEHQGVTRGVLQEGQQKFSSIDEALAWIEAQRAYYPTVFRDDGLVVSFAKVAERRQINVEVWQIIIKDKKPDLMPGSDNEAIIVNCWGQSAKQRSTIKSDLF